MHWAYLYYNPLRKGVAIIIRGAIFLSHKCMPLASLSNMCVFIRESLLFLYLLCGRSAIVDQAPSFLAIFMALSFHQATFSKAKGDYDENWQGKKFPFWLEMWYYPLFSLDKSGVVAPS